MSNDPLLNLINATPYKWPTWRLAQELGTQTGKIYRRCSVLEKYGLVSHKIVKDARIRGNHRHSVWFRRERA